MRRARVIAMPGRTGRWLRAVPLVLSLAAALGAQRTPLEGAVRATLEPDAALATHRVADIDGDGRFELVTVAVDGGVTVWSQRDGDAGPVQRPSELRLDRPEHAVLALADFTHDSQQELVAYDDRGVRAFLFGDTGAFSTEPLSLIDESRMRIRVGQPRFADIVRDLNGDGLADLVLPIFDSCQLWIQKPAAPGQGANGASEITDASTSPARFELAQTVAVPVSHRVETRASNLADSLVNVVRVPRLDIADLNGDGRPDLRARDGQIYRFFLQGEDGRFAARAIQVDLAMFRDTTPEAELELGETVVLEKEQQMQSGDLDADGIPDYVIAHRRKVWSFLASGEGPQFQRADTRVVAEDISGLMLMHLDDDARDDLFVFKIDTPTAAELLLGLVSSIDVPIHCLGYRTGEDGTFERSAHWKRTLTLRIPSITRLLSEATDLVQEFMATLSKLRWSTVGDFDGDDRTDLALVTEDETAIELWRSPESAAAEGREVDVWLRKLFFEDPDTVFDVDRLLKLTAQIFDTRTASMTGERRPDARVDLPVREGAYIVDLFAADFDGDGRDETVVVTEKQDERGRRQFDIVEWR